MKKECLDEQGLLRLLALIKTELSKYVKAVEGKGLSSVDFTKELLDKLNSAADKANSCNATLTNVLEDISVIQTDVGDIEAAIDRIIAIQNEILGGGDSGGDEEELVPSEGLAYEYSSDWFGYAVIGPGTCTDTFIVIPDTHEGLPVIGVAFHGFEMDIDNTYPDIIGVDFNKVNHRYYIYPLHGCSNLETLIIRGLQDTISFEFSEHTKLKHVIFRDMRSIGLGAFCNCVPTAVFDFSESPYSEPPILGSSNVFSDHLTEGAQIIVPEAWRAYFEDESKVDTNWAVYLPFIVYA